MTLNFIGTFALNDEGPDKFFKGRCSSYRLDIGDEAHKIEDKIGMSNGLAWDVKEKAIYYVDSLDYTIRKYDYDLESGHISNCIKIFNLKSHGIEGICDGMTIDTDGNLWVAIFGGNQVIKVEGRTGKLLQSIPIPTYGVTSLILGGSNLDLLYVTSANLSCKRDEPMWGAALFAITGLGVRGLPCVKAKINLK